MATTEMKESSRSGSVRENYLTARQEWDERYGSLITRAKNWRVAFILVSAVALMEGLALMTIVRRSQVVPFVIAVNDLHQVVGMGVASQSATNNPLLIQASLQSYIEDARSVSSDPLVLKDRLSKVFDETALASPAYNFLQETWRKEFPFTRADTETVEVEVHNVTQLSPTSYEVDWSETRRDKTGNLIATEQWKGVLGIVLAPPKDEGAARRNPLGVYVNSITWSKSV